MVAPLVPVIAFLATGAVAAPIQERGPNWFDDFFSRFKWEVSTQTVNWEVTTQTGGGQQWGTTIQWGDWGDLFSTKAPAVTSKSAVVTSSSKAAATSTSKAVASSAPVSSAAPKSSVISNAPVLVVSPSPSASSAAPASSSRAAVSSPAATTSKAATSTSKAAASTTPAASSTTAAVAAASSPASASSLSADATRILKLHNDFRAQYGAAPLKWSTTLADYAQKAANTCKYGHTNGPHGENIAAGVGGGYDLASGFKSWADEASLYDWNKPGYSDATGHFTQIVWKATTELGCAVVQCPAGSIFSPSYRGANVYLVCEYAPRGNVINAGYFDANVGRRV